MSDQGWKAIQTIAVVVGLALVWHLHHVEAVDPDAVAGGSLTAIGL